MVERVTCMVRYYYCRDGVNVEGPVEYAELVALVRSGAIRLETPVCTEGIDKWWTAANFVRSHAQPQPAGHSG